MRALVCALAALMLLAAAPPAFDMFLPGGAARHLRNGAIEPIWLRDGRVAWRHQSADGATWLALDPRRGTRAPAFDHAAVATGLTAALGRPVTAGNLPVQQFDLAPDGTVRTVVGGDVYACRGTTCAQEPRNMVDGRPAVRSPDGRWLAYVRDHDLHLRAADGTTDLALTNDGTVDIGYAGSTGNSTSAVTQMRSGRAPVPALLWSPDSRRILTHRVDERDVGRLELVETAPPGAVRPRSWTWHYSYPGEAKALETLMVFEVPTGRRVAVDLPSAPLSFTTSIEQFLAWWSADATTAYVVRRGSNYRTIALHAVDTATGRSRVVLSEAGASYLELGDIALPPMVHVTRRGEVIWYSRRSGHGHLYRYDLASGRLRNAVTAGPWTVREIVHVDESAGRIFFLASGREPGSDPYFRKLYSVGLDGRGLRLIGPEDGEHEVAWLGRAQPDPLGLGARAKGVSPDAANVVVTVSHARRLPETVLRRADGRAVATLARGELVGIAAAPSPEPFQVLAADGRTTLHGTLYRPPGWQPGRRYPIVDSIYAGPQALRVAKSFRGTYFDRGGAMLLAQRGMFVMVLDARGTPNRSQAFLDYNYRRLDDPGLDDHVAALRQLAQRHPEIDIDRVGIQGISGGGYATARAMFTYPDFFKAGVATAGNHDQRAYLAVWGETYGGASDAGDLVKAANAPLAANLKGKLLLIHGELDDNVHPAHTLQVADALIAADKDFELLIVPGATHGVYSKPYVWRRTADFLARHLGADE